MIKGRTVLKIVFFGISIPLMFMFNNCAQQAHFAAVESSSFQLSENENLCTSMSSIQGDMRLDFVKNQNTPSILEFGTFENNYWHGSTQEGKAFERRLEFNIVNKQNLTMFFLDEAAFDDWMSLKINGQIVFVGPYGGDRLELLDRQVQYGPGQFGVPELSTSWQITPNVDLKPYLINGDNTLEMKVIVAGAGEGAIRILVQGNCGEL